MRERIEQIRQLLSQLESEASQAEQASEFRALSGLELPDIIRDVVDLLMPELRQEGEPSREGTLYRVLLPEEIEVCQRRRAEPAKL